MLCTHNSARSQMMEGWVRRQARQAGIDLEVCSAGIERTQVKPEAVTVMAEVGIDLSTHTSKSLIDLADPWDFDLVLTVCDEANEACPVYPARTVRRHVSVPDPSGNSLVVWREVRDVLERLSQALVEELQGELPSS